MNVELTMLVYAGLLLFVLVFIQALVGIGAQGLMVMAGTRDELPPPKTFQARTRRVVDNHREGLTMFAPLVLACVLANATGQWTALGAQLFFYSRLVHAVAYLAAIPLVRSAAWGVGMAGTAMVGLSFLRLI